MKSGVKTIYGGVRPKPAVKEDPSSVLGYKASSWIIPAAAFGFCGGVASAFNPGIGLFMWFMGFLCSVAMFKSFFKTVESIAKREGENP